MSFKGLFLCALAIFGFVGCSLEDQPTKEPIVVHKGGADCLAEMGDKLSAYFEGKMSNPEVAEFWDCTAHAISEYERLTAGEGDANRYKPENVLRFLEKHFMGDVKVSNELLYSLMEVKRVVLAGKTDVITRAELHGLIEFIAVLKEVSQDLNPYARVLFLQGETASDEEILAASEAFRSGLKRLAIWLDQRRESYSFQQLETLLDQLDEMAEKQFDDADVFERFRAGMDVLPAVKAILLAGWSTRGPGDLNGDRNVDAVDLAILLAEWGPCVDV